MGTYEKGSRQIKIIIGITLGLSLFSIILASIITGTESIVTGLIRFGLTAGLCYFLHNGKRWAKIVLMILFGIAALVGAIGISNLLIYPIYGVISLIYTIAYGYCVVTLYSSKHVKEYFSLQNI